MTTNSTLCALALTFLASQPYAGTLTPVDLNRDGSVDAYLESTSSVLWYRQADIDGAKRFTQANDWANSQTFADLTTWRLPDLSEIQALYATLGNAGGQMNPGPFSSVTEGQYWTSTRSGSEIAGLDVRTGNVVGHVDNGASLFAWAVSAPPVPEPSTNWLLALGTLVLLFVAKKRT